MLLSTVTATLLITQCCWAIPLDQFYPFGNHVGDQEFSTSASPQAVPLSDAFFFYDPLRSFNNVYVAANGIIMFESDSSFHLTPQPFPVSGIPYIAPYWFDHSVKSTVYYRKIERTGDLTTRASREIRRAFPNVKDFYPSSLVILTWSSQSNMVNQFQCVLASKDNLSFVIFHYADGFLQQTLDKGCKFEYPVDVKAQAGLNAGDDRFEMIEVGTDVSKTTNVGIPGVWMYQTNERTANKPTPLPLIEISTNKRPRMIFSVRLTNESTKYEGAVEVYYNGEWGAVCDNGWDINDAHVVCNQLYLGGARNARHSAFYGQSSGKIWLDGLNCTGTEKSIEQCPHNGWGTQSCNHSKTAGVKCTTVRLVDGPTKYEGRVEVYHDNQWGTVCDDFWGPLDAQVVCRQLGFGRAISYKKGAFYGEGIGKIWLDDLVCDGHESFLGKCEHAGWGVNNCGHGEDAGVQCAPAHQPNVTVKVTGEQIVGQSIVVECKIEAAIDIDSTVDIICTTGNNVEMRRLTNVPDYSLNNYSVFFSTPLLSRNDDNRRYQCEVITNTSPQVKATGSVTLNVTFPVVVINAPDEQILGESLTLECKIKTAVDIDDTFDIIWTNSITEVRRVENIPANLISNYSDLYTIPALSRSDDNRRYQCEVIINTNPPVSAAIASITLEVRKRPQMIISPSKFPHRVTVGTQLLLYCAAEGIPTPTVQWYSNGVLLLHPLQQTHQQLYLVPTDSPHTTVYTCIGRNSFKGVNHVSQANVTVIVEKNCPTLIAPSHGRLTTSDDGEFAFFSCKRGYNIRGSNVLQCINGEWNMQPPTCHEIPESCHRECNF